MNAILLHGERVSSRKMPFFDNYKFRFCRIDIFVLFSGFFPNTGSNTEQAATTGSNQKTRKLFYRAFTDKTKRGHGGNQTTK
jgi:hypothetical protein